MTTFSMDDPDVQIIRGFFSPAIHNRLSPAFVRSTMDEIAMIVGGGSKQVPSMEGLMRALEHMPAHRAEEECRRIAQTIRNAVERELARIGEEREELERDIAAKQRRRDEIGDEIADIRRRIRELGEGD